MKNVLILLLSLILVNEVSGQTKHYLRFDSIYVMRENGNGELILLNSTRDSSGGVLTNIGKGRTAFLKTRVLNDSTVIIGKDTLVINGTKRATDIVDAWRYGDDGLTSITPFTDSCGNYHTACNQKIYPQFIGKRVRINVSGMRLSGDCTTGWWYTWNSTTGLLSLFPGETLNEGLYMPIIVEEY